VSQWNVQLRQSQTGYIVPFYFIQGQSGVTNVPKDLTGWTAKLAMRKPTGKEAARITGTNYGTFAEFTMTAAFLASPVKDWKLILEMTQGSNVVNQASGSISIDAAPELDAGDLVTTRSISIGNYTWSGMFSTSNLPPEAFTSGGDVTTAQLASTAAVVRAYADGLVDDLSGVTNPATARDNLGLGTASTNPATAFATAAQGLLADTALQPGDSNTNLSNDAGYLTAYIETDPIASSNLTLHIDDTTAAHVASAISVTGTAATVQAQLTELETGKLSTAGGTVAGTLGVYGFRWDQTFEGGDGNYHILQPWAAIGGNNGYGRAMRYSWGVNSGYIPFDAPSADGRFYARDAYNGTWVWLSVGCTNLGTLATQSVVAASSVTVTNTEGNVQASITALEAGKLASVTVDGVTITGNGTTGDPLVAVGGSGVSTSGVQSVAWASQREPYYISSASTVTVMAAWGNLLRLDVAHSPCTITAEAGLYATNYTYDATLELHAGTNTIAWTTAVFTNTTLLDISTTKVTTLNLNKPQRETVVKVRQ
jgi:hypothetical protein